VSISLPTPSATTGAGYDDLGHGDPALLLLPGWCGDRTLYDAVREPLGRHRRVIATDLRGQGGYADQRDDFDANIQVDDLVDLADHLGLDRVIPVAAAHAGWLAIELRRRLGADRVPGIVFIDWMMLGTPPGFMDALAGLQDEHAWQDVRAALFTMWTDGVGPQVVHDYVASMGHYGFAHWSRAGREIAASFTAEGSPLEALSKLDEPCEALHVYAQPTDDGYLAAQQAFAADHAWFSVARMDACSHFPMLEVPGAVAGRIERFVSGL
jgi:pimeloyl-ACP methyl ester carboxylesterase